MIRVPAPRLDLAGRLAMLAAGIAAQTAAWLATHQAWCLLAPALLVAATVGARDLHSSATRAFVILRVGACVALTVWCGVALTADVLTRHRPPSTAAVVGATLLIGQLVQAALVKTPRDVAAAAPFVCMILLLAGLSSHGSSVLAAPFAVALTAMVTALTLEHHAELVAQTPSATRVSALGLAARHVGAVGAIAAVAFALLPHPQGAAPAAKTAGAPTAALGPGADTLDLRARTTPSDAPVFVTDAAAPTYWQGGVYDHFDGTRWTVADAGAASRWTSTPATGAVPLQQSSAAPALDGVPVARRTDSVQVVSPAASMDVLAPGRAVAYRGPGVIEADAIGNLTITGAPRAVTQSRAYDVVSVAPVASQAALAAAHGPDPADQRWLQLPSDLSGEARTLAREVTRGAPDRVAAVESIERYLRANETYSLSAPLPADGVDAVDDFLFSSHQGSCEQFATAEVVLLRSVGIPSRLVTGYAHGDVSLEPGKLVMRESDAHAWAQVWYPGIGWVNSDPTPSGPPTAAAASPAPAVSSWPIAVLSARWARALGRWWPVPVALIVIMGAAGHITRRRRRSTQVPAATATVGREGSEASSQHTAVGPIAQACLRLADSGSGGGRQAAETLREVAERVGVSAAASPTARAALEAMDRECYSQRPPTAADAAAAAHMFDQAVAGASTRPLTLSR